MHMIETIWNRAAELRLAWRLLLKVSIFVCVFFFILNPNPKRFAQQIPRYFRTEELIQKNFPGVEDINRELDILLPPNATPEEEFSIVQDYVYQHIAYEYDWENWTNIDFWPTAEVVWARQREDCDGRAVLAASILRSRGFHSATLAGSFRHIWVQVDRQELMNPDTEQHVRLDEGKLALSLPSRKFILESTAFYVAEFPTIRNLILLFVTLLLSYHPNRNLTQFFGIMVLGLVGFILFKDWAQDLNDGRIQDVNIHFFGGLLLLGGSFIYSLAMSVLSNRRKTWDFRFCQITEE